MLKQRLRHDGARSDRAGWATVGSETRAVLQLAEIRVADDGAVGTKGARKGLEGVLCRDGGAGRQAEEASRAGSQEGARETQRIARDALGGVRAIAEALG